MTARDLESLDPSVLAVLAKALTDAANKTRTGLEPGKHAVDAIVTLRACGTVSVAADTTKIPTCTIPLLASLALLVKRMGVQREAALDVLKAVMVEALSMGKDAQVLLLEETGVEEAQDQIRSAVLAALPKAPVKGAVKCSATVIIPTA
jgi:hypothetical protein